MRQLINYLPIVLILAFSSLPARAESSIKQLNSIEAPCENRYFEIGRTQIQVLYYARMDTCVVQVVSLDRKKTWRSYSFFGNGVYMVFNNFGPGPISANTGARAYFLFPRRQNPTAEVRDQNLIVTTASGEEIVFDSATTRITKFGSAKFSEDPKVQPKNQGGFEIQSSTFLALDLGFRLGEMPHSESDRSSKFIDPNGETCQIENLTLFDYIYEKDPKGQLYLDEVILKFKTDEALIEKLAPLCPELDLTKLGRSSNS